MKADGMSRIPAPSSDRVQVTFKSNDRRRPSTLIKGGHVFEECAEAAVRECARAVKDVALETVTDPRPHRLDQRIAEDTDKLGEPHAGPFSAQQLDDVVV
jgi:hypothetical protein